MKKGISLIVLVITIIVMIILAASVVITLSNTDITNKADKSTFIYNLKNFVDEYNVYLAFYLAEGNKATDLNVESENMQSVIKSIPDNSIYKEKLAIISGELTYMVDDRNKDDVERAKWACEAGVKVYGMESCGDIEFSETHKAAFEKRGNIYYNTPDLTGFNPEKTFFVSYDADGNEKIGNNISKKPPENWFDYENKEWANVVVVNESIGTTTYFVWIPRYAYKVDKSGKKVDVRFVNNSNEYVTYNETKITYNDTEPMFDADGNQTNYVISSAFYINLGKETSEVKQLSGFWMSKYELNDTIDITNINTCYGTNYIEITGITHTGVAMFDYYLDGNLIIENTGTTYKFENLKNDTIYNIKIVGKSGYGEELAVYEREITTLGSNTNGMTTFKADARHNSIIIYDTSLTDIARQNRVKTYEYYLDDELITTNTNGKYTFEGLERQRTYKVTIKVKDTGIYYGEYTRTFTTPEVPVYGEANAPELGELLKAGTYYLTWDADGNEIRTEVVDESGNAVAVPDGWYDYSNKKWANIVVVNESIGATTYFVWIPKYEYRVMGAESSYASDEKVDIAFIPTTRLEATPGYILHSAFDVNMGTDENPDIKHLPGFWMTKYELNEVTN
ncbi:MAG: hypothetical protein IKL68_05710 [Clostridia bacterium]|nr:hypothetical protein [Clostridia bacterium]